MRERHELSNLGLHGAQIGELIGQNEELSKLPLLIRLDASV